MSISKSSIGFTTVSGPQLGSGTNQIGLLIGEDSFDGDVQFTISVNGVQIGGVQTTTAIQADGTREMFTLNGNWAANSTVSVNFINDGWDGQIGNGHDRNLYVDGLTYNGTTVSNNIQAINWNGPSFYSTQAVIRAGDFVESLGVTAHLLYLDTSYVNETAVLTELHYLGFDHMRDGGATADPASLDRFEAAMAAGVKFDFASAVSAGLQTATSNMEKLLALYPGSVISTEGINEVPASFSYGSLTGQGAANLYQQQLYQAVHSDPKLAGVAVLNYTLPVVYDEANFTRYGNISSAADYGNVHMYDYSGNGGISNYISTLLPRMLTGTPTSKGFVVTETGYDTLTNGDDISAKYLLDAVFDLKQAGASMTYLYELMDENPDPGLNNTENHYGLFNSDGTPKLAATAFHNVTTILADPGANAATFTPETLGYKLTGLPDDGNSMVLAKSSGSFDLVIWAEPQLHAHAGTPEEVAVPVSSVTVTLGKIARSVQVFDPLLGLAPVAVYTNVNSMVVGITDHPVILQITPTSSNTGNGTTTPSTTPKSPINTTIPGAATLQPTIKIITGNMDGGVTLAGSSAANSTVTVSDTVGGVAAVLGTVTASSTGSWSLTSHTKVTTAAINSYSVAAQDAAGHTGSMGGQFLLASTGVDTLTGTTGVSDVFAIMSFKGSDVIKGFETNAATGSAHDVVDFSGRGISSFSQLQPMISGGSSASITIGGGKMVTLSDVAASTLTAADFRFS